jgi:hypothetical protein
MVKKAAKPKDAHTVSHAQYALRISKNGVPRLIAAGGVSDPML